MLSENIRPCRPLRGRSRGWAIATLAACGFIAGCGPDHPDPSLTDKPKSTWRVVTLGVPPEQATGITTAVAEELQHRGLADIIVTQAGQVDHILEINVLRVVTHKTDGTGAIVADETLREGRDILLTPQGFFHVAPSASDAPEKALAKASADLIESTTPKADHAVPAKPDTTQTKPSKS